MKIIYRISDVGYPKEKPQYINNENCLRNFCFVFNKHIKNINVIADNCCVATLGMIRRHVPSNVYEVSAGNGAETFNMALDMALKERDDEIIYFVENDYIHLPGSDKILEEGFDLRFSFVFLYDHPYKYKESGVLDQVVSLEDDELHDYDLRLESIHLKEDGAHNQKVDERTPPA